MGRGNRRSARWLAGLMFGGMMMAATPGLLAADGDVDLALVIALDCSGSVDAQEFELQMSGLGRAFQREEVVDAIRQGRRKRIAVSVMQWSGLNNQITAVPWTIIASESDARDFAALVSRAPRGIEPTATSISSALVYADALLNQAPRAARQVVDVAADGPNNIGPPLKAVRDRLLREGIVINGLAIQNEWRALRFYLEDNVAGGEGHFVVPASDYDGFADAILKKLVREITGPGTS